MARSKRIQAIRHRAVTAGLALLLATERRVPLRVCRAIAHGLGLIVYYIAPGERRQAFANLDMVYGDTLTFFEKRRIVRSVFESICTVGAEFAHTHRLLKDPPGTYVTILGLEHLESGRGAIFSCAHTANWEWMAPAFAAFGHPIAEVVNVYPDAARERLINAVRLSGGVEPIPRTGAISAHQQLLAKGTFVGIVSDHRPKNGGVPVQFFGHACWATPGPALLAIKTGQPVHFVYMRRNPDGTYTMEVFPRIPFERTGDTQQDIQKFTQIVQDHIERAVRANPGQWIWTYNRWKPSKKMQIEWDTRSKTAELRPTGS